MIGTIITTTVLRDGPSPPPASAPAPSSNVGKSYDARQTEALLPISLSPLETESKPVEKRQDVQGPGKDSSSLVEDLRKAAERANRYFRRVDTHLEFLVSEQTGRVIINVINSETQEVVRQIPPEKMQRLADLTGAIRGLLFEDQG
jgi:flagellar protein FlaG